MNIFGDLIFAALILIWPTIAIADKFRVSQIPSLVKAVKGNIIRIYIIGFIIYLPFFAFNFSSTFLPYMTGNLDELYQNIVFDIHYFFSNIIYFSCICVDVAFISLIYKDMKYRKKL